VWKPYEALSLLLGLTVVTRDVNRLSYAEEHFIAPNNINVTARLFCAVRIAIQTSVQTLHRLDDTQIGRQSI
jgi:hypothetical protein